MNVVASAFIAACRAEIEALKPGNVHVFAGGHGMEARDFLISAEVSAAHLARKGAPVGQRILAAVDATLAATGTNTNLGILLLCAPLAAAFEGARAEDGAQRSLEASLLSVLNSMQVSDSKHVFAAIRLANPGGLGRVEQHDLAMEPDLPLRLIMESASQRDRIARAFADGYRDVFVLGLEAFRSAAPLPGAPWWPQTATYLAFLSNHLDTHVIRKWGMNEAVWVKAEANKLLERLGAGEAPVPALLSLDRAIKARGLNPGTSADFTVATLFCERLLSILRQEPESG